MRRGKKKARAVAWRGEKKKQKGNGFFPPYVSFLFENSPPSPHKGGGRRFEEYSSLTKDRSNNAPPTPRPRLAFGVVDPVFPSGTMSARASACPRFPPRKALPFPVLPPLVTPPLPLPTYPTQVRLRGLWALGAGSALLPHLSLPSPPCARVKPADRGIFHGYLQSPPSVHKTEVFPAQSLALSTEIVR